MKEELTDKFIERVTHSVIDTYAKCKRMTHITHTPLPSRQAIINTIGDLMNVLYPGYYSQEGLEESEIRPYFVSVLLDKIFRQLKTEIACAMQHGTEGAKALLDFEEDAREKTIDFFETLPTLALMLEEDIQAAFDGDPAAKNYYEIVFCYPGIEAVSTYRLAHELFIRDVPMIPRMMTEYAHSRTGVDIHPGAKVGKSFFIDHCTGVVIGETTEIGNNVKLYQGVTLGALSFPKDASGKIIRRKKRHPTLEDNVVVYANATILGGQTVIGHDAVIGSNVWITKSVAPNTVVTLEKPSLKFKEQGMEFIPSTGE